MNGVALAVCRAKTARGLTWDELCARARVRLADWMCGAEGSAPSEEELRRIAAALEVPVSELCDGKR